MGEPTVATRILEELRRSSRPLDDDELSRRLNLRHRQQANQACRALEQAGRLQRYRGADGKIVNDVRSGGHTGPGPSAAAELVSAAAAGDSAEQRRAEGVMLAQLGQRLGVELFPRRFALADGVRVELDGADRDLTVLVEAWAHQGPPKPAQRNKVLADALRLMLIASTLPVSPRLILCLSDPAAAHHFTDARSWAAEALRRFGVSVEVVELPDDVRAEVLEAQARQYR